MVETTTEETQRAIAILNALATSRPTKDTEYALAEALRRCLVLAREGSALKQDAALGFAGSFGRSRAKFDGIIAVADSTLAAYGLEDKHAD